MTTSLGQPSDLWAAAPTYDLIGVGRTAYDPSDGGCEVDCVWPLIADGCAGEPAQPEVGTASGASVTRGLANGGDDLVREAGEVAEELGAFQLQTLDVLQVFV
jgi:hypothetical protein